MHISAALAVAASGQLRKLLTDWSCAGGFPIYALYRKTARMSPKLAAFLGFVAEAFAAFDPEEITLLHDSALADSLRRRRDQTRTRIEPLFLTTGPTVRSDRELKRWAGTPTTGWHEPQGRQPPRALFEYRFELQPGEWRTETIGDAEAKGDMRPSRSRARHPPRPASGSAIAHRHKGPLGDAARFTICSPGFVWEGL
jgi:hypothetical protein